MSDDGLRYAWGPCPYPDGRPGRCHQPRPHVHYSPGPGQPFDVILEDPFGRRWYHPGYPADPAKEARGLPLYRPTDPVAIDQEPYLRFAAKRGEESP